MSVHSPRPWRPERMALEWIVTGCGGADICTLRGADARAAADARLIGAAPDLLELLRSLVAAIEHDSSSTTALLQQARAMVERLDRPGLDSGEHAVPDTDLPG